MHFANDISIGDKLLKNPLTESYREKIIVLVECGSAADFI